MPAPDPRVIIHLARAQAELSAAVALLGADVEIELPAGVEAPCAHPKDKRHDTFGGHGYCTACGKKW